MAPMRERMYPTGSDAAAGKLSGTHGVEKAVEHVFSATSSRRYKDGGVWDFKVRKQACGFFRDALCKLDENT